MAAHNRAIPARDNLKMDNETYTQPHHIEDVEIQEWLESLDSVLESSGAEVASEILQRLRAHATVNGIDLPFTANTPYANTFQPTRRRRRFMKSASIIFSARGRRSSKGTRFISRGTRRREFMLARSWKEDSAFSNWKISGVN